MTPILRSDDHRGGLPGVPVEAGSSKAASPHTSPRLTSKRCARGCSFTYSHQLPVSIWELESFWWPQFNSVGNDAIGIIEHAQFERAWRLSSRLQVPSGNGQSSID